MGMGMNPGMVGGVSSGPTSNGSNGSWQGQQIGSPGSMHRQSPGLQGEGMPTRMPTIGSLHPNMPMEARRGSPGLPGTRCSPTSGGREEYFVKSWLFFRNKKLDREEEKDKKLFYGENN